MADKGKQDIECIHCKRFFVCQGKVGTEMCVSFEPSETPDKPKEEKNESEEL